MAFSRADWKMGKCLDWYTQLPLKDHPQSSPVFCIQNLECYFDISKNVHSYKLCLETKEKDFFCYTRRSFKSFPLVIYVNYDGQVSRIQLTDANFGTLYSLESSINFQKSVGLFISFTFVFEHNAEVELSLPSKTKIEKKDKTIQTESLSDDRSIQTSSYLNGNVSSESMPDDFSKLLETGFNHDAEIKCGKHSLKVHKAVLCARSEVLKTMLQSNFLEGQTGVIEIQDMDASYFRDFIHYLYTGLMPELTFDKAKTLYEVGDKYDVRSLMFRCSEYLQDNLSKENAFECFLLGDAHSDQNLKNKIKEFLLDKKVYLEEEYWEPFCEKFPMFTTDLYRLSYKKRKIAED